MARAKGFIPPDKPLRHGQTVLHGGEEWRVWTEAPGRDRWWLIRYDEAGKCHSVSASRADLTPLAASRR